MTWNEFNDREIDEFELRQHKKTDIDCPKCGRKIYFNSGIILTTYPSKYSYWCRCGWVGHSSIKWQGTQE